VELFNCREHFEHRDDDQLHDQLSRDRQLEEELFHADIDYESLSKLFELPVAIMVFGRLQSGDLRERQSEPSFQKNAKDRSRIFRVGQLRRCSVTPNMC